MMLRPQKYDLTVNYKKGSEMYLDDTLSKVFRQPPKEQDCRGDAEKYFVVLSSGAVLVDCIMFSCIL